MPGWGVSGEGGGGGFVVGFSCTGVVEAVFGSCGVVGGVLVTETFGMMVGLITLCLDIDLLGEPLGRPGFLWFGGAFTMIESSK